MLPSSAAAVMSSNSKAQMMKPLAIALSGMGGFVEGKGKMEGAI
jgi:hypothetical protein